MDETYWKEVWERKGRTESNDLAEMDGFENVPRDAELTANRITKILKIKKTDKVLEVGCGAGALAQYLDCDYVGTDYSQSLVAKHIKLLKHSVMVAEANDIPFKDKYFDKAFVFSVFHYFPDKEYANKVIQELKRVCKGKIFIGDLPITSHRKEHLLFNKNDFEGEISDGFLDYHGEERFNVLMDSNLTQKNILLNPGPINVSERVRKGLTIPDLCHREREFYDLMGGVREKLVKVVNGGESYTCVIFTGSGTAAVESIMGSVYGKLLIIINGDYGKRIEEMAGIFGIDKVSLDYGWNYPDLKEIEDLLKKDPDITHVAMVHHETTTGLLNPIREVGEIVRKYEKVFIVDTISSFGGEKVDVVEDNIDFCASTPNKCLQGFPGMSFVVAKKSELKKLKNKEPRSLYLGLYNQYNAEENNETPFTPAIQILSALDEALDEFFEEGLYDRNARYALSAKILREGLKKLGFKFLLPPEHMSSLLTAILLPDNLSYQELHDKLKEKGYVIYAGKGALGNRTFRIANMGVLTKEDIKKFLTTFKGVLDELNVDLTLS